MVQSAATKRTKNQHVVPRMHLKHFRGDNPKNMVWTYDAVQGVMRPTRVEETGAVKNFYSIRQEDGTYFDGLDQWLTEVETAAAAPYVALLEGEIPVGQRRMDFATFIAALFARSPALIRAYAEAFGQHLQLRTDLHFHTRDSFNQFMDRFEADTGTSCDRDELFEFWNDKDRFWMEISQKRGLRAMAVADDLRDLFFERNWYVLRASEGYFITSDNPVVKAIPQAAIHPLYGDGGFKHIEAEVTVPLSPSIMLLILARQLPSASFELDADKVWHMNRARAHMADRFLFAHRQDARVMEIAEEFKDTRLKFEIGWSPGFSEIRVKR